MENKIQEFIDSKENGLLGKEIVVRLSNEIINMTETGKVIHIHKILLHEDINVCEIHYRIHYFNSEGESTDELYSPIKNFTITGNDELSVREFPSFNIVIDKEGNPIKDNAIKLLRTWRQGIPLDDLIKGYMLDRDSDGLFNRK